MRKKSAVGQCQTVMPTPPQLGDAALDKGTLGLQKQAPDVVVVVRETCFVVHIDRRHLDRYTHYLVSLAYQMQSVYPKYAGGKFDMNPPEIKVALITGANTGIGKEVARQLGLLKGTQRIYLACRNESKAQAAKQGLEQKTGRSIFEIILMDVSDPNSVRSALSSVKEPLDALVMNAGGSGGKTPLALTKNGVTDIFAQNVLGHVVLLDSLLKSGQLAGTAIYLGSEAARGVPKMGMKRPAFATSSANEFASVCNGEWFRGKKPDSMLAYGQVKYLAALWMAATARQNPQFKFLTISPGNTRGTEIANSAPLPMRLLIKYLFMPIVGPLLGMAHPLEAGAKRIVDGLTDPALKSGVFYGSKEDTLTGPIVDQSTIVSDLNNETYQDNAWNAVHRFVS